MGNKSGTVWLPRVFGKPQGSSIANAMVRRCLLDSESEEEAGQNPQNIGLATKLIRFFLLSSTMFEARLFQDELDEEPQLECEGVHASN